LIIVENPADSGAVVHDHLLLCGEHLDRGLLDGCYRSDSKR
jgi:hypothetical protein